MLGCEIIFTNWSKKTASSDKTEFKKKNCTREEIESCLAQTQHDCCYFDIEYFFKGGSKRITLSSENSEYYMMYSDTRDEDEDGDLIIKNYWNRNRSGAKIVEFGGEYLQDFLICDDFNDVKEIFRQFLDEDRVSEELMD